MVLTGLRRQENVQRMLVVHNVISTDGAWEGTASCPAFESMDEAIMWCEHHFKEVRPWSECIPLVNCHSWTCPYRGRCLFIAPATNISTYSEQQYTTSSTAPGPTLFFYTTDRDLSVLHVLLQHALLQHAGGNDEWLDG